MITAATRKVGKTSVDRAPRPRRAVTHRLCSFDVTSWADERIRP